MKIFLENWLKRIEKSDQKSYGKRELETMIKSAIAKVNEGTNDALAECRQPMKVNELRRGDVFLHKLVGGKLRPWIALRIEDNTVVAVAMSSGDSIPNAIKSQCRYWSGSWIPPTVTNVRMDVALEEVTRPYTNLAHLAEIEQEIAERFSPKRIRSIADIIERRKAKEAA